MEGERLINADAVTREAIAAVEQDGGGGLHQHCMLASGSIAYAAAGRRSQQFNQLDIAQCTSPKTAGCHTHANSSGCLSFAGIVFIDEIDKIVTSSETRYGADASSEGVQRDLLPIIGALRCAGITASQLTALEPVRFHL